MASDVRLGQHQGHAGPAPLPFTSRPRAETDFFLLPIERRNSAVFGRSTLKDAFNTTPYNFRAFWRLTNPSKTSKRTRPGSRSKGLPYPPPPAVMHEITDP